MTTGSLTPAMDRGWSQFGSEPPGPGEELPWDGDPGHQAGNMAAVAGKLRAWVVQLLRQARQRTVRDRLRCRRGARGGAASASNGVTLIHVSYGVGTTCSLMTPLLLRAACAFRRGD